MPATRSWITRSAAVAALVGAAIAGPALAANPPDFVIDSLDMNVPGDYYYGEPYTQVARNSSGDFVVQFYRMSWSTTYNTYLRAYNADGTPKGGAIPLGTKDYYDVHVAISDDGSFAAAYSDYESDSTTNTVTVQRYAADGTPQGAPIAVGADPVYLGVEHQLQSTGPRIAMDAKGDIVVAWTQMTDNYSNPVNSFIYKDVTESSQTWAAVYAEDGSVVAAPQVVDSVAAKTMPNTGKYGNHDLLDGIATYGKGDIVMSFLAMRGKTAQVTMRKFQPTLAALGGTATLSGVGTFQAFGADGSGNVDIEWTASDNSLYVSRYSSKGAALGSIGPIETPTTLDATIEWPTLSVGHSGNFAVTWGSTIQDPAFGGAMVWVKNGQYFHADGSANGSPFVIDDGSSYQNNFDMETAVDGQGNLLSVWTAMFSDGHTAAVLGRLTTAP